MTLTEARATESAEKWDGLRPRNVVQAATADIERRKRNDERTNDHNSDIFGEKCEQYAFMREHVKDADGPFGLIQCALEAIIHDRENPQELFKKTYTTKAGKTVEKWVDPSLAGRIRRSTKSATMKHLYSEPLLRAALELEKRNGQ